MIFKMLTTAGVALIIYGLLSLRQQSRGNSGIALMAGICFIVIGSGTEYLLQAHQKDILTRIQLLEKNKNAVLHCTDHHLLESDQTLIVNNWKLRGNQVVDRDNHRVWHVLACNIDKKNSNFSEIEQQSKPSSR